MNESEVLSAAPKELFIAGAWQASSDGARFPVEDPATGEPLCEIADATTADALAALDARPPMRRRSGRRARRASAATSCGARSRSSRERTDELAMLMSLEMGKSLAEARAEVAYANDFLRWFSEEAVRIRGSYTVSPNGRRGC